MSFTVREGTFDAGIFQQVFHDNEYELDDLRGMTILDIGCHIGSFALKAAANGAYCVVSFEPNPSNFALAERNLEKLDGCAVNNMAVGRSDKPAAMKLDMSDNALNFGGSCTVTDHGQEVDTISLDILIEELSPQMIKIDAEGAEYPILYTSTRLAEVDTIFGEFHNALGTQSMGIFELDKNTPDFLADFKGRLNIRSLTDFLKEQGFRVLVDDLDANIGHFWASRTFQGLAIEPAPSPGKESALFPGKPCVEVDLSSGSLPDDGRPMVFCIGLPDEKERQEAFDRQALAMGQGYTYWPAFDARGMSREEVEEAVSLAIEWDMPGNPGALRRPTEVGLLISSVELWQDAVDNDLPYLAVMEDDSVLAAPLKFSIPIDADIVFFNDRSYRREDGVVTGAICGTDGYLLTRAGLRKMLRLYSRFWMPVDLQWQPQIQGLRDCEHILSSYSSNLLPSVVGYALPPYVSHSTQFASSIR